MPLTKQEKLSAILADPEFETLSTQEKIVMLSTYVDRDTDWQDVLTSVGFTGPEKLAEEHRVNLARSDPDVLQRSGRRGTAFGQRLVETGASIFDPETYEGLFEAIPQVALAKMAIDPPESFQEALERIPAGPMIKGLGEQLGRISAGDPEAEGELGADLAVGAATAVGAGGLSKPRLPTARPGVGAGGSLGMGRPTLRAQQLYQRVLRGKGKTFAEASSKLKLALRLDKEKALVDKAKTVRKGTVLSRDIEDLLPELHRFAKAEGHTVSGVRDFSKLAEAAAGATTDSVLKARYLRIAHQAAKIAGDVDLEMGVAKGRSAISKAGERVSETAAASMFPGGKLRRISYLFRHEGSPDHAVRRAFTKMDLADPEIPPAAPKPPEIGPRPPSGKFSPGPGPKPPPSQFLSRTGEPALIGAEAPRGPMIPEGPVAPSLEILSGPRPPSRKFSPGPQRSPTPSEGKIRGLIGEPEPRPPQQAFQQAFDPFEPVGPLPLEEGALPSVDVSTSGKSSVITGASGPKPRIRAHLGAWDPNLPPGQPVRLTPLEKSIQLFERFSGRKPPRVPPRHGRVFLESPFER